ncbi:nociceptin receptor-like [Astyanax mexicanus]|uniref:Nociceptin receptor-like n=1 Tax=Astyanax mexicanus TaxID=7994 RepID=A0A8T2L2K9_ASTMX|nr:nociceptin receptor-like [Astyanax mexicanus]
MQRLQVNISSSGNLTTEAVVKMIVLQVLVGIFLYVNCLMIFTFLKKEVFRGDTRYILFAQTLFVDSAVLFLTDVMLLMTAFQVRIHMISCIIVSVVVAVLKSCTPMTLVAMCLERYVAICMPLRHADISSSSRIRFFGFLIIWTISSITALFTFVTYISVAPPSSLSLNVVCSIELMLDQEWQAQARAIMLLTFFLMMISVIIFTYIKIMIAARAASSEKKKSTSKCLRTVLLHGFQMFLCVVQFITPYIEMPLWKLDIIVFINVRYSNFIMFIIVPRCLSPLIYGLRDEKFFAFHSIFQLLPTFARTAKALCPTCLLLSFYT